MNVSHDEAARPRKSGLGTLTLAAIGVIFGDIGTSPLYAMKEAFAGPHPLPLDRLHIFGVVSLAFWTLLSIVSVKYLLVIMRADNHGEGGSLSLLALLQGAVADRPQLVSLVGMLGVFAAALFYGDAALTPAISVLSAVEGLTVIAPSLERWVLPLAIAILVGLFLIQSKGTAKLGSSFGVVTTLWFIVLAVMGVRSIASAPGILAAVSPHYAIAFLIHDGWTGFLALGSVVLAVTGAEALYADMGHFGRGPIRIAWYVLVWPALILNYFGQGALLLTQPDAVSNPFYLMAPSWALIPLVALATCATVIASQAVISGAFSVTWQAVQLGYLPRMAVIHTSASERGQIYMPFINALLMVLVLALILGFRTSGNLAAAYGVAVTGTMTITTLLTAMLAYRRWGWRNGWAIGLFGLFLLIDLAYFLSTMTKIAQGGWFPLAAGAVTYLVLTTWSRGRRLVAARLTQDALPVEDFFTAISDRVHRAPGTAIFLCSKAEGAPHALLHNLKHNHVLHERVALLTVLIDDAPRVPQDKKIVSRKLRDDVFIVTMRCGYMEDPDIPKALANARMRDLGFEYEPMRISYFLTKETVVPSSEPGMALWREKLFAFLGRSFTTTADYFHLPLNRVVELGGHIAI
jgi:KUP system potassium uptake protein